MTRFYSRQDDFKKNDFVNPQSDLISRLLTQIDDAGASVQSAGLSYLYSGRGQAVLGAGKTAQAFLEAATRSSQLLYSAAEVHAEVLQNIDSKLVKGLDEAFTSLNAVNNKITPYKTTTMTYETMVNGIVGYDMVNGYRTQKVSHQERYTLDEILDRKNSPILAVQTAYFNKAQLIRQKMMDKDDLTAEEIEKIQKMTDEELLETYYPRLSADDQYERIKGSTFHELNKGSLSELERGVGIVAGLLMVGGIVFAPVTGGASLYASYIGGTYLAGNGFYSAATGNTIISGTQLSTTERVFAGVEALATVFSLGGASAATEGLKVGDKTTKLLVTLGNVGDKLDNTMDVAQFGYGLAQKEGDEAFKDLAFGRLMDIGFKGVAAAIGKRINVDTGMRPGQTDIDFKNQLFSSEDYLDYVQRKKLEGKTPLSEVEWRQKVDALALTRANYETFKTLQLDGFKSQAVNVQERITIEITTASGEVKRVQVNAIGVDADGRIRIQEYTTAQGGLSINRQQLLEDLSKYGGTVVGKGKGEFTGGIEVPKGTQIEVISQKTGDVTVQDGISIQNTGHFNTVGQEIVTFTNQEFSPTAKAQSWQGTGLYPGIDTYVDIRFNKGDKIYILESDFEVVNNLQSGYATTLEAVEKSRYDSRNLSESLQIKPYYNENSGLNIAEYRQQVTEYIVTSDDLYAAFGEETLANPHFGDGGAPQYFIKDFQEQVAAGKISRGESRPLNNFEISLEEYDRMINQVNMP